MPDGLWLRRNNTRPANGLRSSHKLRWYYGQRTISGRLPCVLASCCRKLGSLTWRTRETGYSRLPRKSWWRRRGSFCAVERSASPFLRRQGMFMSYLRDSSHTLVLNSSLRCPAALDFGPQLYEPGDHARADASARGELL